jgi:hypothetical protein
MTSSLHRWLYGRPPRRSARLVAVAAQRAGLTLHDLGQPHSLSPWEIGWVNIQSAPPTKLGQYSTGVDKLVNSPQSHPNSSPRERRQRDNEHDRQSAQRALFLVSPPNRCAADPCGAGGPSPAASG